MKGIIELDRKPTDIDYIDIILCVRLDGADKPLDKAGYVTWVENKSGERNFWVMGHYFDNVRAALWDFDKRK